jgi:hypothetical protein
MRMYRSKGPRRYWPRSRAGGCLLWIVLLIVLLVVFSLLFGGFQKGTKSGGLVPLRTSGTSAPIVAGTGARALRREPGITTWMEHCCR